MAPRPFNFPKYLTLLSEIELDIFFSHSTPPSIPDTPPPLDSIRQGFVSMTENLYNRARERDEIRRKQEEVAHPVPFGQLHMDAFDPTKMANSPSLRQAASTGINMYLHSQALLNLFRCFYFLTERHRCAMRRLPELRDSMMETMCGVFGSIRKSTAMDLLEEAALDERMLGFLRELYNVWENEIEQAEREILLDAPSDDVGNDRSK